MFLGLSEVCLRMDSVFGLNKASLVCLFLLVVGRDRVLLVPLRRLWIVLDLCFVCEIESWNLLGTCLRTFA